MDKLLGTTLENRYLIEELIGVGGMADVYKAFDRIEQKTVAVKMLREEYARDGEFLRRFRNETRAINSLDHPNIVKIYDVMLGQSIPCIVMEYVAGTTLKDYIYSESGKSIKNAVSVVVQLLKALSHAHENGIVHRDVKPQNVMLLPDGSIKVMDFGIARFAMSQSRTISNQTIGSVHYISPEQANGESTVDHQSDIYSVGIILYEMLCRKLPFDGDNPIAVAIKQVDDAPVPPTLFNDKIPEGLEEIVLCAMAKSPKIRYLQAEDMLYDLNRFIKNPTMTFGYGQIPREQPPTGMARKETENLAADAPPSKKRISAGDNTSKTDNQDNNPKERIMKTTKEKKEKKPRKKKKITFLSVLFGITCAFIIGALIFVYNMFDTYKPFERVPDVDMPAVVGFKYTDIVNNPEYSGFEFVLEEEEYSNHQPAGYIYDQYPTAGKHVKEGSTIRVKVSKGMQSVVIPSTVNQEGMLVSAKLQEMGLIPEMTMQTSSSVKEGMVIYTEPGSDTIVSVGATIQIVVSSGTGNAQNIIPNVIGSDVEIAKQAIVNAGFKVGDIIMQESEFNEGMVLKQSPNYPAPAEIGTVVDITVATNSDSISSQKVATLSCIMPIHIDEMVTLRIVQDSNEILNEYILPVEKRVATASVVGQQGDKYVTILINDKIYAEYKINFDGDDPAVTMVQNNTVNFQP